MKILTKLTNKLILMFNKSFSLMEITKDPAQNIINGLSIDSLAFDCGVTGLFL